MAKTADRPDDRKPRRSNGEGSVFFWPGRGRYAAVTNSDGRRVMRRAPRQTRRGAETLLRKPPAQRHQGEPPRGADAPKSADEAAS